LSNHYSAKDGLVEDKWGPAHWEASAEARARANQHTTAQHEMMVRAQGASGKEKRQFMVAANLHATAAVAYRQGDMEHGRQNAEAAHQYRFAHKIDDALVEDATP
jgi:hypothetical protein